MFPLGTVLVPSLPLPLHVFEPRYRALVRDCLAGDREFGVVLIERGSEVGGGDTRSHIGTVARLLEAVELPNGRWAVGAVGTRRLRVRSWLPDDPYPRAEVEDWPDPPATAACAELRAAAIGHLRRALALSLELGDAVAPAAIELSEDPVLASYQLVAVAPIGPLDQQRLLGADTAADRLEGVASALEEVIEVLELRRAEH